MAAENVACAEESHTRELLGRRRANGRRCLAH